MKYNIVNSNSIMDKSNIDYFYYIIILILLFYTIYLIISLIFYQKSIKGIDENFANSTKPNTNTKTIKPEITMESLKSQNNYLTDLKDNLEKTLDKQSRAIYITKNYLKVDESSYDNELNYLNSVFNDTILPSAILDEKILINTRSQLQTLIDESKNFKNLYKEGDMITNPSTFGIEKNDICYNKIDSDNMEDTIQKYPECMVCSINDKNYKDYNSWKTTKTNIKEVCLYNPNAGANSDILNYDGCKKICGIDN